MYFFGAERGARSQGRGFVPHIGRQILTTVFFNLNIHLFYLCI